MAAAVRFFICCPARTGSTMLTHLLRSNPAILCHGEVLQRGELGHITGRFRAMRQDAQLRSRLETLRERDLPRFINEIVFDPQGRAAVGFKFKTDESFSPDGDYARAFKLLVDDVAVRVIFLYRRDLFAQFVSYKIVNEKTGVSALYDEAQRPQLAPFRIDVDEFRAFLADVLDRQRRAEAVLRPHCTLRVAYEDLVERDSDVLDGLQEFLGVPPRPLDTGTLKIVDRPLAELIENHDDCRTIEAAVLRGVDGAAEESVISER